MGHLQFVFHGMWLWNANMLNVSSNPCLRTVGKTGILTTTPALNEVRVVVLLGNTGAGLCQTLQSNCQSVLRPARRSLLRRLQFGLHGIQQKHTSIENVGFAPRILQFRGLYYFRIACLPRIQSSERGLGYKCTQIAGSNWVYHGPHS